MRMELNMCAVFVSIMGKSAMDLGVHLAKPLGGFLKGLCLLPP